MISHMKRHPWLVPFSRDHHNVLFHALRLRRATPETAAEVRVRFLVFWQENGPGHFDREEATVLPALGAGHPLAVRVLGDHAGITSQVADLAGAEGVETPGLHRLGETLAEHVRFEERELFPLVERELSQAW